MGKLPSSPLQLVVRGVLVHQGKVVLVKHRDRGWEFPGGEQVGSEKAVSCLKRYVAAQVSLGVRQPTYIGYTFATTEISATKDQVPHAYVLYFFATVTELAAIPPNSEIVEVASVTAEEARYLFRESAAELGITTNHQQVLNQCIKQGLISLKSSSLSSIFVIPPQQKNEYRLNISRSFSSLYAMVKELDKGTGMKPFFEYGDKRIYLSVSNR